MHKIFRLLAFLAMLTLMFGAAIATAQSEPFSPPTDDGGPAGTVQAEHDPDWVVQRHDETGTVRFLSTRSGAAIPQPGALPEGASHGAAALNFLSAYADLFGLRDPATELSLMKERTLDEGKQATFVRFQQLYQGVPVLGGELIVQLDAVDAVVSVSGETLPGLNLSTSPRVSLDDAVQAAQTYLAKVYELDGATFVVSKPELWVYNPVLLGAPGLRENSLVWRMEVTHPERLEIRELVLVDAAMGRIQLNFNQVDFAKNRLIYDNNNVPGAGLPGTLVRSEGQGPSGITDVNNAYDYAGFTYDYYFNVHGRDSIDGKGLAMVSTTRYCFSTGGCPLQNAFWNGSQMIYGAGFASADDVVGHELTHGVTEHESALFYYMQSGAINESLSDVWGEFIDLSYTNGLDNDSAGVRWDMGEDVPGFGAIRDMADPGRFGDPDKMTSSNYYCGTADNGGVHWNSGVSNKAVTLMVDGGSFNGYSISALGMTKTAKIWYRAATNLLTSGSDYKDLGNALVTSCQSLVGAFGITPANCVEVDEATDAVEMHLDPPSCPADEAPVCVSNGFNSQFNGSAAGWVAVHPIPGWAVNTNPGYLFTSGVADDSFSSVATTDTFEDLDYQARMRRYGGTTSNGVMLRGTPAPLGSGSRWNSGYGFYYTSAGLFSVWRYDGGSAVLLASWTASGAINTGDAFNNVRVVAQGSAFYFYINGTMVWSGSDSTYSSGHVGLIMYRATGSTGDLFQVDWATATVTSQPTYLFNEDFENPNLSPWIRGYFTGHAGDGWYWYNPQNNNPYSYDARYGTGAYNVWGYDFYNTADYYLRMGLDVTLPADKTAYLHFDHAYDFEGAFDGGVLEYSANGGGYTDAGGLPVINGYNGTISNSFGNPLGGRAAFVNDTDGMSSTRYDLGSLAGQDVRFRFRIGTDSSFDDLGWMVDNFKIYTCQSRVRNIVLPLRVQQVPGGRSFHSNFNSNTYGWSAVTGAWADSDAYYGTPGLAGTGSSAVHKDNYSNFRYTARMLRTGNLGAPIRLIIRGDPTTLISTNWWSNGYVFQYTNDGDYSIYKYVAGVLTEVQGWTSTSAIIQHDEFGDYWNVPEVYVSGSSMWFYINDVLVWSGTDASLSSGKVGLGMFNGGGDDQLYVDWVSLKNNVGALSTPDMEGLSTTISPEQQALNASPKQGGTMDQAP